MSPRTVLKYSGQSLTGTAIALTALALAFQEDLRDKARDEFAHLLSSTQSGLFRNRAALYEKLSRLPKDYVHTPEELAAAATDATAVGTTTVQPNTVSIDVLGKRWRLDLGDLHAMSQKIQTDVKDTIDRQIGDEGRTLFKIVKAKKPVADVQPDPLPFARPSLDTRIVAWVIDSACVGLLASLFTPLSLYGTVSCLAWLSRDYLLTPFGLPSPGYYLTGLEKVHVKTCQKVRPETSAVAAEHQKQASASTGVMASIAAATALDTLVTAVDTSSASAKTPAAAPVLNLPAAKHLETQEIVRDECMGMLGHNTLRFLTYCSSLGPISTLVSLGWTAYALINGVEETVDAWDKLAGVRLVYKQDVDTFAATGRVPVRTATPHSFQVNVLSSSDKDSKTAAHGKGLDLNLEDKTTHRKVVDLDVRLDKAGNDGASKVVVRYLGSDGRDETKEFELPRWMSSSPSDAPADGDNKQK
ncbi:hypothetical protein RI367_004097 [Sorochytrium milnesiophthora]